MLPTGCKRLSRFTASLIELVKIYINCSVALSCIVQVLLHTFYDSFVLQVVVYLMTDTSN